ncbi:Hypothetical predicted protein [Mytilus galloprovincialis]|uniref:DOMON domain-containing protein n=2 Tax=Mytilus galloprovincialis TaxID=29158 RepID=A0A8B6GS66_MYTGA|nr:Hypothetical predicted protein [Mytilus galloprovincialis]
MLMLAPPPTPRSNLWTVIEVTMTAIKTNFNVLVTCVLCFLIAANLVNCFSKDSACGDTHGCWGDCDGGCSFILMWTPAGSDGVHFSIKVSFSSFAHQWAAFAISTSKSMQNASATSCIVNSTGIPFLPENSYNAVSGHTNTIVTNPLDGLSDNSASYSNYNILTCALTRNNTNSDPQVFDLMTDYYILFAKGPATKEGTKLQHYFTATTDELVDFQSTKDLAGGVAMIKPFTSILIMLSVSQIVLFSM